MFVVSYVLEDVNGKLKNFTRSFQDITIVESEMNFAPGSKLKDGTLIKRASYKKEK